MISVNTPGTLYIVSTPIGNLEDMTLRALRILKEVDLIAAEDTRHTRKLLSAYDIHTPLTSYFDQNETRKSGYLLQHLLDGKSIALVSDAGTPGISDPGYEVIVAAIAQHIAVTPIPGPSAMMAALTVSGLPLDRFVFIGFLTNKRSARIKQLKAMQQEQKTLVCYASPHHLRQTLADIHEILGNRRIAAARELTKKFEEIVRGSLETVMAHFPENVQVKGEFTLVIAGADIPEKREVDPTMVLCELQKCVTDQHLSKKDAVKYVARALGLPKNLVYQESLKL